MQFAPRRLWLVSWSFFQADKYWIVIPGLLLYEDDAPSLQSCLFTGVLGGKRCHDDPLPEIFTGYGPRRLFFFSSRVKLELADLSLSRASFTTGLKWAVRKYSKGEFVAAIQRGWNAAKSPSASAVTRK
jgi:hypothetical protein